MMTTELTQITNLIKSKMKKLKIYVMKKYIKLNWKREMAITPSFLILKVF